MAASEFLIDKISVYDSLGADRIRELSRAFYRRVYGDSEEWFRKIFAERDFEMSVQNQSEFFIQRFGGPALYSQRKGHPALRARHVNFHVDTKAADRWVKHMRDAMEEVKIPEREREALDQFFLDVAYFLRNREDA